GQTHFAEVLYFTRLSIEAEPGNEEEWQFANVVLIQLYSPPDKPLLKILSQTVASCACLNEVHVLNVKKILSVITMVLHTPTLPSG
ncbi:hypothetical protein EDD22DRAFT_741901, partial [Suillus occidentalis]